MILRILELIFWTESVSSNFLSKSKIMNPSRSGNQKKYDVRKRRKDKIIYLPSKEIKEKDSSSNSEFDPEDLESSYKGRKCEWCGRFVEWSGYLISDRSKHSKWRCIECQKNLSSCIQQSWPSEITPTEEVGKITGFIPREKCIEVKITISCNGETILEKSL